MLTMSTVKKTGAASQELGLGFNPVEVAFETQVEKSMIFVKEVTRFREERPLMFMIQKLSSKPSFPTRTVRKLVIRSTFL